MATGSLHATFLFKKILVVIAIITPLLFSLVSVNKVHAARWFSVYGAGVLTGSNADESIINNQIPEKSLLPANFFPNTIQSESDNVRPSDGALISSGGQNVKVVSGSDTLDTEDAYFKNIDLNIDPYLFDKLKSTASTQITNCSSPALYPNGIYRVSVQCLNQGILSSSFWSSYSLRSPGVGLAILVAEKSITYPTLIINSMGSVKSSRSDARIMIITDAKVLIRISSGASATFTRIPDMQLSIITTNTDSDSISLSSGTAPVVVEGPLASAGGIKLGARDVATNYPSIFVKYNPLYLRELSKIRMDYDGLLEAKTTWRRE